MDGACCKGINTTRRPCVFTSFLFPSLSHLLSRAHTVLYIQASTYIAKDRPITPINNPYYFTISKYALLHLLRRAFPGRRLRSERQREQHRKSFFATQLASTNTNIDLQVVAISTGSTTLSTTVPYTNGFTSYLTQTNSLGVVTGMPEVATAQSALPTAITSQPAVATIPAGLPEGNTYLLINISRTLTSFEVSVGSSTTVVVNAPESATIVTGTGTETAAVSTGSSDDSSSSGSSTRRASSSTGSSTGGAAESTGSADSSAGRVTLASAGVLGFGALVAAFL
jgi:hypothetical protein